MLLFRVFLVTGVVFGTAWGHGRLIDPPSRNSMWRFGFHNPVNYNDNELYCGGRMVQWSRNEGKCGVCGDPWHEKRQHEVGGKYANGIVARTYRQGDDISVAVHLTANHLGWFEFRLCPLHGRADEATQECLDEHLLRASGGSRDRFPVPRGKTNAYFNYSLKLPDSVSCERCVFQWKYRAGNTWDKDSKTGLFCVGCGPQEEFYNCADIVIESHPKNQRKHGASHGIWDRGGVRHLSVGQFPTFIHKSENGKVMQTASPVLHTITSVSSTSPSSTRHGTRYREMKTTKRYHMTNWKKQLQVNTKKKKTFWQPNHSVSTYRPLTTTTTTTTTTSTSKDVKIHVTYAERYGRGDIPVIPKRTKSMHSGKYLTHTWANPYVTPFWHQKPAHTEAESTKRINFLISPQRRNKGDNDIHSRTARPLSKQHWLILDSGLPSTQTKLKKSLPTSPPPCLLTQYPKQVKPHLGINWGQHVMQSSTVQAPAWPVKPVLICRAIFPLSAGMDEWCFVNCNANYCPGSFCHCQHELRYIPVTNQHNLAWNKPETALSHLALQHRNSAKRRRKLDFVCQATSQYAGQSRFDRWCQSNCFKSFCPSFICKCNKQ